MKTALNLTLSRPTGEGTAIEPRLLLELSSCESRARILEMDGERFSLSPPMGEGRGEGKL
ncbi:MAG: hypothetical protein EPO07_01925 [Verrucomicrobia bacterium]|nr:MAG: hypothetical protein EPO07_01925 [Verrucomicrobiota bacterium]